MISPLTDKRLAEEMLTQNKDSNGIKTKNKNIILPLLKIFENCKRLRQETNT